MKTKVFLLLLALVMVLMGCELQDLGPIRVATSECSWLTTESVTLEGTITGNKEPYHSFVYGFYFSTDETLVAAHQAEVFYTQSSDNLHFYVSLADLEPGTTYYYCAWVMLNATEYVYGEVKNFTIPTKNLVEMPFSVSPTKKVYFSSGNLQYHPLNNQWRFASQQMDYLGSANRNTALTYDGWIDLFGWSTEEGFSYFGVSTDTAANYYSGTFKDWGCKRIGRDEANTWRTMSLEEWSYVTSKRNNCHELIGCALVMGVKGLILLPDDWQCPEGVTFKPGFYPSEDKAGYGAHQNIDDIEWQALEHAGAIFLPAAGYRAGLDVSNVQVDAFYWTSTANDADKAYYMYFNPSVVDCNSWWRHHAYSVRLVRDVE